MFDKTTIKLFILSTLLIAFGACSSGSQNISKSNMDRKAVKSEKLESDEVSFKFSAVRPYRKKLMPLWFKNLDPDHQSGNLPIALNSPLIHDGYIFIGKNDGHMKAYDGQTGRLIWNKFDKGDYHAAPVAFGKNIIYGTGEGRVYARNYKTGKIKYAVDLDASVESKPVIYKGKLYVHLRNHKLFCLDAKTGKIIWAYKRSVPYLTTLQRVSTPLVKRNKVYVGFADGYIVSFSAEDGVLLWERKIASGGKFVDVDVTPVIRGKTLFVNSLSNQLSLLDSATGALQRKMPYTPSRAPLFTKDGIILGTTNGEIVSLNRHYQEIKKIKLADGPISSIVPWKNYYIITSASQLLKVVHRRSLRVMETFNLGHASSAVFGQVTSKDGILAFMSSRSRLYVFK
jgi:outer membrane protein assembly factor BamB